MRFELFQMDLHEHCSLPGRPERPVQLFRIPPVGHPCSPAHGAALPVRAVQPSLATVQPVLEVATSHLSLLPFSCTVYRSLRKSFHTPVTSASRWSALVSQAQHRLLGGTIFVAINLILLLL